MKIQNIISVALFAFLGGCCRALFSHWLPTTGVIVANLLGCFLLSFLTYFIIEKGIFSDWLTAGLGTGLVGAFTTFSTFAVTTVKLAQLNQTAFIYYFIISSFGGLVMTGLGFFLGRFLGKED